MRFLASIALALGVLCGVCRADVSFVIDNQASGELTALMEAFKPEEQWSWGVTAFRDSRGAYIYFADHSNNGGWLAKRNDGDGSWSDATITGTHTEGPRENQAVAFDVNNDGFIDIVHTGDESPDAKGYRTIGDGSFVLDIGYRSRRPSRPPRGLNDYNSDGFTDIRWLRRSYGITTEHTATNDAGNGFIFTETTVGQPAGLPAAVSAKIVAFENDKSDTKNRYAGPVYFEGDIDNDGDSDVLVSYGGSYGGIDYRYAALCLRNAAGTLQEVSSATSGIPSTTVPLQPMIDLNGDGMMDFISQSTNGGIYIQTSPGVFTRQIVGGNFETEIAGGVYPHSWYDRDLDGDGDTDLVISCRRSRTAFILDNQAGTFVVHRQVAHADGEPLGFVDYDNDGDQDIICWGNATEKMGGTSGQTTRSVTVYANQSSGTPPPADTTPPTVTGTIPADTATDISVDAAPTVAFNEALSAGTVNTTNVRLLQGATPLSSTVSLSGQTAMITPDEILAAETVYTISVDNVEDAAGNAMAAEFTATFTTAAAPDPSPDPDPPVTDAHTGITLTDEEAADQTGAVLTGHAFVLTVSGDSTGGATTRSLTIDGEASGITVDSVEADVSGIPGAPTPPTHLIPLPDYDEGSAAWGRWRNHVEANGGSAEEHALLYAVTGDAAHRTLAIDKAQAIVTADTVAGNQYLKAGPHYSDVFKTMDWCDPPTSQANAWKAWGLGHLGETDGSVTDSIWWTQRWSRNNPANNYYHSFVLATSMYAMAAQNSEWLTFLKNDRLPRMFNYYATTPEGGSREGTGYGESHRSVFALAKLWRDYDDTEILPQAFINNSLLYWTHATTPGHGRVALIGDHTRTHGTTDGYHRDIIDNALQVATDANAIAVGKWQINRLPPPTSTVFYQLELRDWPDNGRPPTTTEYWAEGAGHFFSRTSWATDATYVYATAGLHDEAHQQEDQGAFAVFANGRYQTCSDSPWTNGGIAQASDYQNVVRFSAVQNIRDEAGTLTWAKRSNTIDIEMDLSAVTGNPWQRRIYWPQGSDFLVVRDYCDPQYPFNFEQPSEDDERAPYISAALADTASSANGHITIVTWPEDE